MNDKEQLVYDYVKKHKPAKQSDIVKGIKKPKVTASEVHNALKFLMASGKVDYTPARFEIRP